MSCYSSIELTDQAHISKSSHQLLHDTNSNLKICQLSTFCFKEINPYFKKEVFFSMKLQKDFTPLLKMKMKSFSDCSSEFSPLPIPKIMLKTKFLTYFKKLILMMVTLNCPDTQLNNSVEAQDSLKENKELNTTKTNLSF